jgi:hypothetical protein
MQNGWGSLRLSAPTVDRTSSCATSAFQEVAQRRFAASIGHDQYQVAGLKLGRGASENRLVVVIETTGGGSACCRERPASEPVSLRAEWKWHTQATHHASRTIDLWQLISTHSGRSAYLRPKTMTVSVILADLLSTM